jgi:hypothetical protein
MSDLEKRVEQLEKYHKDRLKEKCYKRINIIGSHDYHSKSSELEKVIPNFKRFFNCSYGPSDELEEYLDSLTIDQLYDILDVKLLYCTGDTQSHDCNCYM